MSTIFTRHSVFYACLSSCSDCSRFRLGDIHTCGTMVVFITGKPKDLQLESQAGIKMALVLGSPLYICDFYPKSRVHDITKVKLIKKLRYGHTSIATLHSDGGIAGSICFHFESRELEQKAIEYVDDALLI